MSVVNKGSTIKIRYTGTFDDGTVFDSTKGHDPLEIIIGKGLAVKGLEDELLGMETGEKKKIRISREDAYGEYKEDLIIKMKPEQLPKGFTPEVGKMLQLGKKDGEQFVVTVTKIEDDGIVLDANHPLSGKDLNFEVEIVSILD